MDFESLAIVFGRLHVMAVHFPIALLVVAALFEAVALLRGRDSISEVARALCLPAALFALLAAWSGWTMAEREPPGSSLADTLFWHRWLGVSVLALAVVAVWLARRQRTRPGAPTAFRAVLFAAATLVGFTGHLGGSMVRGEDFLLGPLFAQRVAPAAPTQTSGTPAPATTDAGAPPESGPDFATQVAPIFAASCSECHGSARQKGRLRFDRREDVLERPANRTIVVPGAPQDSELLARVLLPQDDPDFMPAEGEPLTPAQIETLRAWIAHGAQWTETD